MIEVLTILGDEKILTVIERASPEVVELLVEGPQGPPDSRPRPSDIAFGLDGDIEANSEIIRILIGSNTRIFPDRCQAVSAIPTENTALSISHKGINIGSVTFTTEEDEDGLSVAVFDLPEPSFVLERGSLRIFSPDQVNDLRDVSITLSGER